MVHKALAILVTAILGLLAPGVCLASVTGVCVNCHVMHASQVGVASTPVSGLLNNSCLGCHTGTNNGSGTPYVLTSGKTDLTTALAGGNFKFSGDDSHYGHNPLELGVASVVSAPGWKSSGFDANGQVGSAATWTSQLTCDGTWGCHGTHNSTGVFGSHHNNSSGQLNTASTVGNSFRMLYKIKGYEDSDWQFTSSATDHNVYFGKSRSGVEAGADVVTGGTDTISFFCAECHGIFHSGGGSDEGISDSGSTFFTSPWIRHPLDISMPKSGDSDAGEYASYNAYRTDAPLATSSVPAASSSSVATAAERIVMCLSCHQAHATPYYGILRWDYRGTAGSWTNGCSYCHTSKN